MIERPAALLYALAGSPPQAGCVDIAPARCRVCAGMTTRAVSYERWQGANFTDQNKLRHIAGAITCEACVWAHAWVPPPGWAPSAEDVAKKAAKRSAIEADLAKSGKKAGAERPPNLRLFSHLYDARGYAYANKADKPRIRAWLCAPKSPPWFCAIADSGQKHVLPWTPLNLDTHRGVVRLEERDVAIDGRELAPYVTATCELLTAGATKAEIEAGVYRPETWLRCERALRAYEERYAAARGGGLAALVVWLAQRDEAAVAERLADEKSAKEAKSGRGKTGQDRGPRRRAADGGAERVPRRRRKRAEALAADPRPSPPRDEDELADGRVDDGAAEATESREPEQLGLFGDRRALR